MSEEVQDTGNSPMVRNILLGVVGVYILFSLGFSYKLNERIETLEAKQKAAEEKLGSKIAAAQSKIEATNESLAEKVGATQKEDRKSVV